MRDLSYHQPNQHLRVPREEGDIFHCHNAGDMIGSLSDKEELAWQSQSGEALGRNSVERGGEWRMIYRGENRSGERGVSPPIAERSV